MIVCGERARVRVIIMSKNKLYKSAIVNRYRAIELADYFGSSVILILNFHA